jgi:hypothetical protein
MTSIDAAILDLTESVCRRFQRLTGRTNVWLAVQLTNLSIIVFFVWAGLQFLRAPLPAQVMLGIFCGVLLVVLAQTILSVPIETHETSAYRRVENGLRNPRRLRDAPLRISFLTLSVILVFPMALLYGDLLLVNLRPAILLLGYSLVVLTTIVLYLLACDPLPPCPGRVTEWLRARRPSRGAVPAESPGDPIRHTVRPASGRPPRGGARSRARHSP